MITNKKISINKIKAIAKSFGLDFPLAVTNNMTDFYPLPAEPSEQWLFESSPTYHLQSAKSAIVILFPYDLVKIKKGIKIASIGYHHDYHLLTHQKMQAFATALTAELGEFEYKIFADKDGLNDGEMAIRAGLVARAKNSLVLHEDLGTAFNISYLLTDLEIEAEVVKQSDLCGECRRCEIACPNGALCDYKLDRKRCRSSLNQAKNTLSYQQVDLIGDWFFGCDICQQVCPYNKVKSVDESGLDLDALMTMGKKAFKLAYKDKTYNYLGQTRLKRNAMILLFKKRGIDGLANYQEVIERSPMLSEQYRILEGGSMSNIHDLVFLEGKLQELKDNGTYRKLPVFTTPSGSKGMLNGKEIINLSSNNYLGFANHPRVKQAAIDAVEKYGAGSGAVRTIAGNTDLHEKLEEKLAEFKREEAVMVYQSGFNCNAGTIQAITDKGDLIISDELNHASIIDGVKLSKADKAVFKHSDMADLERVLKENQGKYNVTLIITDGVFSMDGDLAKLPEIVELAEKYGALTYVDDAHGSGVLGENGRGTVDHYGLHGRVDFIIGTLSKAIGVVGGYVASKKVAKEWLSHRGRPILFSTSLPPAAVGAIIESVDLLMNDSSYTDKLWSNARFFKAKLKEAGFDTGNSETPITPVIIGDEAKTMEFSRKLLENGVFVSGIVFPTVPKGTGRLRCMVSAAHSEEELAKAVEVFAKVGKEMAII